MHTNSADMKDYPPKVVSTVPPEIEEDILVSFGHAIVEFEDTLFVKFQHITKGIVLTEREFIEDLENMEERGIVVSGTFLGRKCWSVGSEATSVWD